MTRSLVPYRSSRPLPGVRRLWLLVFLAAAVVYALTCQRGVAWQDSGMFQYRAWRGELASPLGLALAHPLYVGAGWLLKFVPIGGFPLRLNVLSALGMAIACANLAAVAMLLTGRRWIAAAAAGMTALAHTPWWLATIAEAGYTWSLAGFTAELWVLVLLIRRPTWGKLASLALLNGLGLCVHNFALLPLPVYLTVAIVLVARKRLPAWSLGAAAVAWLAGAGLYLGMIVAEIVGGAGFVATIRSALFGTSYQGQVLNTRFAWGTVRKANLLLMLINVLGPQVLFVLGAWVLRRRVGGALAAVLGALAAIQLLFVLRYNVPDQFMFFLPALAMVNLLAAMGLAHLARRRLWRRIVVAAVVLWAIAAPLAYAFAPAVVEKVGASMARARKLPHRNETRYWLTPWKHNERSAETFAQSVLTGESKLAENAFIIADSTTYYPLVVVQQLGDLRPDVTILNMNDTWDELPPPADGLAAFFAAAGGRPIYVVSNVKGYCPDALGDLAIPAGDVYLLRRLP